MIDVLLLYQSRILAYFRVPKLHLKVLLPIFAYGVPIAATSLSAWIINQSNKFIMNNISGFTDVGYVGVAYGVTLPLLMTIFSIITVAAVPRIIRMYEENFDVRPIISIFTGYYVLIAMPVVIIISLYAYDFVGMLADSKFQEAYRILPYFAFGTFFMGLTDYTTLQYHLANKTYIDFIIKLFSGIIGIILNILLIPKIGLEGVGVATFTANMLYFTLSLIIVLPKLGLLFPYRILLSMFFAFLPMWVMYKIINTSIYIPAIFQMILLLAGFYASYYVVYCAFFPKRDC